MRPAASSAGCEAVPTPSAAKSLSSAVTSSSRNRAKRDIRLDSVALADRQAPFGHRSTFFSREFGLGSVRRRRRWLSRMRSGSSFTDVTPPVLMFHTGFARIIHEGHQTRLLRTQLRGTLARCATASNRGIMTARINKSAGDIDAAIESAVRRCKRTVGTIVRLVAKATVRFRPTFRPIPRALRLGRVRRPPMWAGTRGFGRATTTPYRGRTCDRHDRRTSRCRPTTEVPDDSSAG